MTAHRHYGRDVSDVVFPPGFFDRMDPTPDPRFYRPPRLVTHIDDGAIAAVGSLYDELAVDGEVLDLMTSWVSHFRTAPRRLVGLGMNADELQANPMLAERVVHDLNARPGPALRRRVVRRRRRAACRSTTSCSPVDGLPRGRPGPAAGRHASSAPSPTAASRPRPSGAGSTTDDEQHVRDRRRVLRRIGRLRPGPCPAAHPARSRRSAVRGVGIPPAGAVQRIVARDGPIKSGTARAAASTNRRPRTTRRRVSVLVMTTCRPASLRESIQRWIP